MKINKNGKLSLPADVARFCDAQPGDQLVFSVINRDKVMLRIFRENRNVQQRN